MLSPSLFGGRRVLVLRSGQDARKDLVTALLAYAKNPDPEVQLLVLHLGGAKGKAFADGLRAAGATVVPAAKLKGHRERVAFVRDEIRRAGGKCTDDAAEALIAAVGNDLRELAAACSQLVADTDGRIGADTVARYYRGRAEVSGFTVADATMVGDVPAALEALRWALHVGVDPVPIADALADGVRTVARVGVGRAGQPVPAGQQSRACRPGRSSGRSGRAAAGRRRGWSRRCGRRRVQRGGQGRLRRPGVRAGAGGLRGRRGPAGQQPVTGPNRTAWATISAERGALPAALRPAARPAVRQPRRGALLPLLRGHRRAGGAAGSRRAGELVGGAGAAPRGGGDGQAQRHGGRRRGPLRRARARAGAGSLPPADGAGGRPGPGGVGLAQRAPEW